jgi:hypothetical protein
VRSNGKEGAAVSVKGLVESLQRAYTGEAFALTILSGFLTIMGERFLYRRRGYMREATITAVIGWSYVIGGALLYVTVMILDRMM